MRMTLLAVLCWFIALPLRADQSNLVLVVDGVTYSNATITALTPTTVTIIHQTGAVTVPREKLPVELQKQFSYDPQKADANGLTLTPQPVTALMPDAGRLSNISAVSENASNGPAAPCVTNSPFNAYDKKLIATVQKRWYALVDRFTMNGRHMYGRHGAVTVRFQVFDDGHVEHVKSSESSVDRDETLLCEKAIVESAPFDRLPKELSQRLGKTPRDVSFTFYY